MQEDIIRQNYQATRSERETANGHKAFTIWLTGFSGAGKSTIANATEQILIKSSVQAFVLDGDNVRLGLNSDLDFSRKGRKENIRRVSEVARLFNDAGMVVITAFISPYRSDRDLARTVIGVDRFIEVFIDASLQCCMSRDVKGLYEKAQQGLIPNFTGVSDAYEVPETPDIRLHTDVESIQESVDRLILLLKKRKLIP
ncbi:MAG: adenylyl-sulfate kinase [Sphingobacteriales bacterium]|nr:MAG: adenylyl-sulfate kinase [Sphingobacteriales bacterium]